MDSAEPLISLHSIQMTLTGGSGPVNILRGLDLQVAAGESVAVVGPSGSGKTTLLMVLAGLERPTSGTVRVAGQNLENLSEDDLARFRRASMGIVFQAFHLVPSMTALENVALPLEFAGDAQARDKAVSWLEAVGLAGRQGHYPSQLSGGEQQRVALARAFAPEPAILLADEPTGNLDADTGQRIMDLLFGLSAQRGTTLVLVTHDKALAARASRRVRMRDGRLDGDEA